MIEGEAFRETSVFFLAGADGRIWYLIGPTAEPLGSGPPVPGAVVTQGPISEVADDRPV